MVFTLEKAFKLDTRKGLSLSKHGELHSVRREVKLHHFLIELLREEKPDQRDRREDLPRHGVVDFPCPRTSVEYSGLGRHVPLAGKHDVCDNTLPLEKSSVYLEKAFSLDTCRSCVIEGQQSRNKTQIEPFTAV